MLIADVGSTLGVLNVPEDVIKEVMTMLEENADALEQRKLNPISGSVFGASSWGSQLGFDASLAQEVAGQEILDMVAGLRGYSQNIQKFAEDVEVADETSQEAMAGIEAATECVSAPIFATPAQCVVPAGDQGGDD